MASRKSVFETQPCGRCGGSGNYSYNQIHGSVCYGCNGSGVVYTKRGQAAANLWDARTRRDAFEIKVGDVIVHEVIGFTAIGRKRVTVVAISEDQVTAWHVRKDNDGNEYNEPILSRDFTFKDGTKYGYSKNCIINVVPQGEERAALIAECLAYQETINPNTGKVYKRKPKVAEPTDDWSPIDHDDKPSADWFIKGA